MLDVESGQNQANPSSTPYPQTHHGSHEVGEVPFVGRHLLGNAEVGQKKGLACGQKADIPPPPPSDHELEQRGGAQTGLRKESLPDKSIRADWGRGWRGACA